MVIDVKKNLKSWNYIKHFITISIRMHLLLQLLDVRCDVNQLFGGQRSRDPALTAALVQ